MMKADAEKRVGLVGVRMVSYSQYEHICGGADQTSRPMLGVYNPTLSMYRIYKRTATAVLGLHANFMSSSRMLLILEGMMTVANRSCTEGRSCDFYV